MVQFLWVDYIRAAGGGIMMGLGIIFFFVMCGRITGMSGIVGNGLNFIPGDWLWRYVYCFGIICSALILRYSGLSSVFAALPRGTGVDTDWALLALSGFLVGFGTALGNGCTSGHGFCGVCRLSIRSIVNTCLFFSVGMITASVTPVTPAAASITLCTLVAVMGCGVRAFWSFKEPAAAKRGNSRTILQQVSDWPELSIAWASALVFGLGMGISEMTNPNKVLHFLEIDSNWDATLMFVMVGAMPVGLLGFYLIRKKREKPVCSPKFILTSETRITLPLVTGGVVFGVGWGLCGLCPGPALFNLVQGDLYYYVWYLSQMAGLLTNFFIDLAASSWSRARAPPHDPSPSPSASPSLSPSAPAPTVQLAPESSISVVGS